MSFTREGMYSCRASTRGMQPPGGKCNDIFGVAPSEPRRTRNTNHLQSTIFGDMTETVATCKTNATSHDHLLKSESVEESKVVETVENASKSVEKEVESEKKPVETVETAKVVESVEKNKLVETVEESKGVESLEEAFKSMEKLVKTVEKLVKTMEEEGKPVKTANIDDLAVIVDSVTIGATSHLNQGNPLTGKGYAIANGVKKMDASPTASVPSPVKMNGNVESKTNETAAAPPLPEPAAPRRVRQPPGGFCSNLW